MKSDDARRYRHPIIIQVATESQGADGSIIQTWTTFARTWASITPKRSTEALVAQGVRATSIHEIEMRYIASVVAKMQILFGTRVFNILGVNDDLELNRKLTLTCVESV